MAQELELKLCLTIEAAETLIGSPLFAGASKTVEQRSLYFDTPDLELIEGGLCLRIREADGRFVQTVKGDSQPGAGLFARSEDDVAVEGLSPKITAGSPVATLIGKEPLLALFEVRNERRQWNLAVSGARIEVALDFGHVVAGDRYSPYVELELELKRGKPSALFDLGRQILALVPARLGVVSKAERGYRLLGPLASRHRAEAISLQPDVTIGQAFPVIAGSCLRHYLLNVELLQDGRRTDARATLAVHQCRVALRRLRAALLVFRPLLRADEETRRIDKSLGQLARVLGEARDLDVLIEKRANDAGGRDQEAAWRKAEVARSAAHERVRATLVDAQTTELLFDLVQWLSEGVWARAPELEGLRDTPCTALAVDALRHYRRRVRRLGKRFGEIDDEKRHTLRKDFKTLRYAAEFFAPLFVDEKRKRERETFLTTLEAVQDRLGDWNDHVTGPRVAAGLGLGDGKDRVTAADLVQEMEQGAALLKAAQRALRDFSRARRFWPQQGRAADPEPDPIAEAEAEQAASVAAAAEAAEVEAALVDATQIEGAGDGAAGDGAAGDGAAGDGDGAAGVDGARVGTSSDDPAAPPDAGQEAGVATQSAGPAPAGTPGKADAPADATVAAATGKTVETVGTKAPPESATSAPPEEASPARPAARTGAGASGRSAAASRSAASSRSTAASKGAASPQEKAPAKASTPLKADTPAKANAPVKAEAPAKAKAPAKARAPARAAAPAGVATSTASSASTGVKEPTGSAEASVPTEAPAPSEATGATPASWEGWPRREGEPTGEATVANAPVADSAGALGEGPSRTTEADQTGPAGGDKD